jgi:peptide deformylase
VVQHECDHLDGMLYPARVHDLTQFGYTEELFPERDVRNGDFS